MRTCTSWCARQTKWGPTHKNCSIMLLESQKQGEKNRKPLSSTLVFVCCLVCESKHNKNSVSLYLYESIVHASFIYSGTHHSLSSAGMLCSNTQAPFHPPVFMRIFNFVHNQPEWKCQKFGKKSNYYKQNTGLRSRCIDKDKMQQSSMETDLVNKSSCI